MRIGFVSQPIDRVLPPGRNSIGIWTGEVAKRLAWSHEVIVYHDGSLRGRPAFFRDNVRFQMLRTLPHSVDREINKRLSKHLPSQKPYYASDVYSSAYALQAALDLSRRRCDLIHIQNFSQFVPIIRSLNPKSRIVLHMHCEWLSQLDRNMIAKRLSQVDAVVGCSEYITEKVRQRFPELAHKCYTLFNGVDETHFNPAGSETLSQAGDEMQGTPRLLFVGRVSPEKGVHTLFDALKIVAERYPDVRLSLIGSLHSAAPGQIIRLSDDQKVTDLARFYHEPYVESLKKSLPAHLLANVTFLGQKPHHEIPGYLREADILVNPSLSESFGMALIEAMACGTPVIASQAGGMVEVVQPGVTGLLVPPDSPQLLAEAILSLLDHPQLRRQLAQAGRDYVVERFSWEKITADCLDLYNKLLVLDQLVDRPNRLIPSGNTNNNP